MVHEGCLLGEETMDYTKIKLPRIDKLAFSQIKKLVDTRSENKIVKRSHVVDLEDRLERLQALIIDDVLTAAEEDNVYRSNAYPTYPSAVAEIIKKYNGVADWGVFQTGNIIDIRAAFIISEGVDLVEKEDDAEQEMEFAEAFLEYNKIDKEVAQDFAKEAEIEGKILLKLFWEKEKENGKEGMVSVRFIPWNENKYKIDVAKEDYTDYIKATWRPSGTDKEQMLQPNAFVYAKFGGRISKPNEAAPKIMKCLTQIENLDKAIRDWREINRLFAAPTPHFECDTKEQAGYIMQQIEQNPNFRIKKLLAHTGKFGFAGPDIKGMTSLEDEIVMNAKMISGATGVPVHFLGLPDLLSNRATAENLMQLVVAATSKERQIWKGVYSELLTKAMTIYNEKVLAQKTKKLDPTKIGVEIPLTMESEWLHFEKVWLPLWLGGKITDELALSKLPGCDAKAEMERQNSNKESESEKLKEENEQLKIEKEEAAAIGEAGMVEPEEVI